MEIDKDKRIFRYSFFLNWVPTVIFACVPFFILVYMVLKYAVNFPWGEELYVVELIDHYYTGTLKFADLWQQHTDHRLLFPNLIFLCIGLVTDFNVVCIMYASVFFALLSCLLICCHIYRNSDVLGISTQYKWLWVAAACFVFSLTQYENWLVGFQLQWLLNVFAVTAGSYIYSNYSMNFKTYLLLICCGIVAAYSLASGIFFWIIILVFHLIILLKQKKKGNMLFSIAWVSVFILVLIGFFYDYKFRRPENYFVLMAQIKALVTYCCAYIGSPLSFFSDEIVALDSLRKHTASAVFIGGLGLLFSFVLFYSYFIREKSAATIKAWSFFGILYLYSLFSAIMTSIGRINAGIEQALSSRYTTVSICFWLSFFVMMFALNLNKTRLYAFNVNMVKYVKVIFLLAVFVLINISSYHSSRVFQEIHRCRSCAQQDILYGNIKSSSCISRCLIPKQCYRKFIYTLPLMKDYRLSVFKDYLVDTSKPLRQ